MKCHGCRIWQETRVDPADDVGMVGECRRHAPPVMSDTEDTASRRFVNWPITHYFEWCGEFSAKPAKPAEPPKGA